MKIPSKRNLIGFAAVLAFTVPQVLSAANPSSTPLQPTVKAPLAQASPSPTTDLDSRMGKLDRQLDSVFANTFRNFGSWFDHSDLASSIDLREQKDKYVVRVYVPSADTSKVNARVEGNNTLHVTAEGAQNKNGTKKTDRLEQIVTLPGPVEGDKMQIRRQKNLVVIDLPKSSAAVASASPQSSPNATQSMNDLAAFDQKVIDRMARMQGRMEQMFRDAFPDDLTSGFNSLRLGSAVNIEDRKDRYVARFYLPDKDLKNVSVKLDKDQLRLTASEAERNQQRGMTRMQSGNYEQVVTLPGPVKEKGMKVERQNGTIVVTLPKAGSIS